VLGQAGITVLCLVYAPNIAVWGAAYVLGPGFAVGAGTTVGPAEVVLGPLPAVPLFAGLPTAPAPALGPPLLAVALAVGVWAGWGLARRAEDVALAERSDPPGWGPLLAAAVLSGPAAGAVLWLAAAASAGALGSGRLARLGPTGWAVGVAGAVVVTLGATVGVAVARARARRW
jgi:hypothetical protein